MASIPVKFFFLALATLFLTATLAQAKCKEGQKDCLPKKISATNAGPGYPPFRMTYTPERGAGKWKVSEIKDCFGEYLRQFNQVDSKELPAFSSDKQKVYYVFALAYISLSEDPISILQTIYSVEYDQKPFKSLDAAVKNTFLLEVGVTKKKKSYEIELKYPDMHSVYYYGEGKATPHVNPFEFIREKLVAEKISNYCDTKLAI